MAAIRKKRQLELLRLADNAIKSTKTILNNNQILESYNGQVASLSVSIAMSGLLPTLAIFYQDSNSNQIKEKAYRRNVLEVVAKMITDDNKKWNFSDANALMKYAVGLSNSISKNKNDDKKRKCDLSNLNCLSNEIIECAIALKQVVRTYNLV